VDEKGRKMSKSLGNVVAPQKVMNSLGADVLRLWVSATDYANVISVSDEILKRMAESYRRMRNTVRFLLGNLYGFDPQRDAVKPADMVALDRWALERTRELQSDIVDAYRQYAFHVIYQKVHNFCIVDLGGFYLDVLKDRLYTTQTHSHARKSAQTAMYHIAESMVRWLAPILSFTAEEIWRFMPGERTDSVFLSTWHNTPETPRDTIDWPALIHLRGDVTRELEKLRNDGAIGSPLDAEVDVFSEPDDFARFNALGPELRFLFITSEARVHEVAQLPEGTVPTTHGPLHGAKPPRVSFAVRATSAVKCVRCWQRRLDVGVNPAHPEICGRCAINVDGPGETRYFA
jgi:isoleucyl-tRNA synthetase